MKRVVALKVLPLLGIFILLLSSLYRPVPLTAGDDTDSANGESGTGLESSGDLAWHSVNSPVVTQRTNANVFAMAADGETMYLYTADNDPTKAFSINPTMPE